MSWHCTLALLKLKVNHQTGYTQIAPYQQSAYRNEVWRLVNWLLNKPTSSVSSPSSSSSFASFSNSSISCFNRLNSARYSELRIKTSDSVMSGCCIFYQIVKVIRNYCDKNQNWNHSYIITCSTFWIPKFPFRISFFKDSTSAVSTRIFVYYNEVLHSS